MRKSILQIFCGLLCSVSMPAGLRGAAESTELTNLKEIVSNLFPRGQKPLVPNFTAGYAKGQKLISDLQAAGCSPDLAQQIAAKQNEFLDDPNFPRISMQDATNMALRVLQMEQTPGGEYARENNPRLLPFIAKYIVVDGMDPSAALMKATEDVGQIASPTPATALPSTQPTTSSPAPSSPAPSTTSSPDATRQAQRLERLNQDIRAGRISMASIPAHFQAYLDNIAPPPVRRDPTPALLPRPTQPSTPSSSPQPSTPGSSSSSAPRPTPASPQLSLYIRNLGSRIVFTPATKIDTLHSLADQCFSINETSHYSFDGEVFTQIKKPATPLQASGPVPSQAGTSRPTVSHAPSQNSIAQEIRTLAKRITIAESCAIADLKPFAKNLADIVRSHPQAQYYSDGTILMTKRMVRNTIRASKMVPSTSGQGTSRPPSTQPTVIPAPPAPPASPTSPAIRPTAPGGLLGAIQGGAALKPAGARQLASPTQQQQNLANLLSNAMKDRRGVMAESDSDDDADDDDANDDDWSDDD